MASIGARIVEATLTSTAAESEPRSCGGRSSPRKGREFEREVREHLRELGYYVQRAPRSGGEVDLLAVRDVSLREVLMIQCKRDGVCGPAEWDVLWDLAQRHRCPVLIALRRPRQRIQLYRIWGPKADRRNKQPWAEFVP